ncbi:alpha/beta fold hydrolase [Phaeovulum sp.]|uniref:alpha/beta fold hydrolase n=1 Tax=Phaeovulum sp. TaxID=2934796 RepID=UPI003565F75C
MENSIAILGLAIVAFAALTYVRARKVETRITQLYPAIGTLVPVQKGVIHALQRGTGRDVVLLHGALANLRDFPEDLVSELAKSYRVTLMDRPGCGYTSGLKRIATAKAQATALAQAADALGLRAPIVVGHSYGATVAAAWALCGSSLPVRPAALVLIAGPLMPASVALGGLRVLAKSATLRHLSSYLAAAWTPRRVMRFMIGEAFAPEPVGPEYAKRSGARLALRRSSFRANARQTSILAPLLKQLAAELPRLELPVELIHGSEDRVVPCAAHSVAAAKLIRGARLTVLSGRGHMPHHTEPQAVIEAISRAALALPA